jgi:hypothetical protein
MKEQTFSKLISDCRKSLDLLMAESQQTLALMLVVKKFPQDLERKTALQLQYHREDRLRLGYQARRADLLRLVSSITENQSDTAA